LQVIRTIVPPQQVFDDFLRGKLAVDQLVPTCVSLHHAVFAPIVLGAIQVDNRPCHVCGHETGHVILERQVQFGGSDITVGGDLIRRQDAEILHLWGNPETGVGHREK
jgi:hypothetical protein